MLNKMKVNLNKGKVEKGKSGIHIKKENIGKFTATKKRTGKSTEELKHSKNPLTRKRATFAANAAKWHHKDGGNIEFLQPLIDSFKNGGLIQKAQTGTKFWGLNNSQYTPEYTQSVQNIISDPNRLQSALNFMKQSNVPYAQDKTGFQNAAFDKIVGPVHNYIYSQQKPAFKDVSILEGFIGGKRYTGTAEELASKLGSDFKNKADRNGLFETTTPLYRDLQTNETIPHLEMLNRSSNTLINKHQMGRKITKTVIGTFPSLVPKVENYSTGVADLSGYSYVEDKTLTFPKEPMTFVQKLLQSSPYITRKIKYTATESPDTTFTGVGLDNRPFNISTGTPSQFKAINSYFNKAVERKEKGGIISNILGKYKIK